MIRPTAQQRALAYVATGGLPPIRFVEAVSFIASAAASLALGVLIGVGVSP